MTFEFLPWNLKYEKKLKKKTLIINQVILATGIPVDKTKSTERSLDFNFIKHDKTRASHLLQLLSAWTRPTIEWSRESCKLKP
jgi:hypothetical protein